MVDGGTATEDLMTHTARHRPRLLLALGVALALSACSSNTPEPAPPTTTTPAPARRPSPTPTPTGDPNPAGLAPLPPDDIDKSFVTIENFFTAYEYGLRTGDTSVLQSLSGDKCAKCSVLVDNIVSINRSSAKASGGSFTINSSTLLTSAVPGRFAWRIEGHQEPVSVVNSDGSDDTGPSGRGKLLIEVAPGDPYVVTAIETHSK